MLTKRKFPSRFVLLVTVAVLILNLTIITSEARASDDQDLQKEPDVGPVTTTMARRIKTFLDSLDAGEKLDRNVLTTFSERVGPQASEGRLRPSLRSLSPSLLNLGSGESSRAQALRTLDRAVQEEILRDRRLP